MAARRSALVTGASRGIGLGVATRMAEMGHALTISARDASVLDGVASVLRAAGAPEVQAVAADVSDADAMMALVDQHAAAFGTMSSLVLAAGVGSAGPLADYQLSRWDRQFTVNTRSAFVAVRQALPMLRDTADLQPDRGAKIIALSSIGGVYAEPGLAAYGAAKAALVSLCRSVNAEESGRGVTATAIAPAYVDTSMSTWIHDTVPPGDMISVDDVVTIVEGLLGLSSRAVVSEIVVSRAGTDGYRA
jgi:3-oxoacyl-[acyl-carrier protein] reductase